MGQMVKWSNCYHILSYSGQLENEMKNNVVGVGNFSFVSFSLFTS
jgi:hypothetical protein